MNRREYKSGGISPVVDHSSMILDNGRQIAWEYVSESRRRGAHTVKLNGAVTAADTEITVDALTVAIGVGQTLNFGGVVVRATAPAAVGDTTIAVAAVPANIADNVEAKFGGAAKFIPAFTDMVALADGRVVPYDDKPGAETNIGFLATNVEEGERGYSKTGTGLYRGGMLYENLLPVTLDSTRKTQLNAAGTGFGYETYGDDRAT